MADIKPNDWKVINEALQLEGGSVLDFTNRDFRDFVYSSINVDVEDSNNPKLYDNFEDKKLLSKGKRLKILINNESDQNIAKLLSDLYEGFKDKKRYVFNTESKYDWSNFVKIISRLNGVEFPDVFNTNIEDNSVQKRLKNAENIFLSSNGDFEKLRNACETVSLILEPLRTELEKSEFEKDIKDFFNVVNNFTIRHNKKDTKKFEFPEQYEWVFYMGYHTIKLYYALKERNNNATDKAKNLDYDF